MDPNLILYPGDVYFRYGGRHYKHINQLIKRFSNNKTYEIRIHNKHHCGEVNPNFNGSLREFIKLARDNSKDRFISINNEIILEESIKFNYRGFHFFYTIDYGFLFDKPLKTHDIVQDKDGNKYEVFFRSIPLFKDNIDLYIPSNILDLNISNIPVTMEEFGYVFFEEDDTDGIEVCGLTSREVTLIKREE